MAEFGSVRYAQETASEEEETTSRTADSVEVTMPLDGDKLKL